MNFYGLSLQSVIVAILVGIILSVGITFVSAPHPVVVPVQVITPVPTPPPVVITNTPLPLPTVGSNTQTLYIQPGTVDGNLNSMSVVTADQILAAWTNLIPFAFVMCFGIFAFNVVMFRRF